MENTEPIRKDIMKLIGHHCGQQAEKFFSNTYAAEILPVFLHQSFLLLKEIAGQQKARALLSTSLRKYSLTVPYE